MKKFVLLAVLLGVLCGCKGKEQPVPVEQKCDCTPKKEAPKEKPKCCEDKAGCLCYGCECYDGKLCKCTKKVCDDNGCKCGKWKKEEAKAPATECPCKGCYCCDSLQRPCKCTPADCRTNGCGCCKQGKE